MTTSLPEYAECTRQDKRDRKMDSVKALPSIGDMYTYVYIYIATFSNMRAPSLPSPLATSAVRHNGQDSGKLVELREPLARADKLCLEGTQSSPGVSGASCQLFHASLHASSLSLQLMVLAANLTRVSDIFARVQLDDR